MNEKDRAKLSLCIENIEAALELLSLCEPADKCLSDEEWDKEIQGTEARESISWLKSYVGTKETTEAYYRTCSSCEYEVNQSAFCPVCNYCEGCCECDEDEEETCPDCGDTLEDDMSEYGRCAACYAAQCHCSDPGCPCDGNKRGIP